MMEVEASDWMWLDTQRNLGQEELARLCAMSVADIDELVDYGGLVPLAGGAGRLFHAAIVPSLREALRLRIDLDLDLVTVSLLLRYLQRIARLESQLRALQATQAQYGQQAHLERDGPAPWREPHA